METVSMLERLVLTLLFASVPAATAEDCSPVESAVRLVKCNLFEFTGEHSPQQLKSSLPKFCSSMECALACSENALRSCVAQGYPYEDFIAVRVSHRYICGQQEEFINAVGNCSSINSYPCVADVRNGVMASAYEFLSNPDDYKGYTDTFCSAIEKYWNCTSTTPWVPEASCSLAYSTILNNLYDVSFSVDFCNIPKKNPLFKTSFARPPTCDHSDGTYLKPTFVLLLALQVFVALTSVK